MANSRLYKIAHPGPAQQGERVRPVSFTVRRMCAKRANAATGVLDLTSVAHADRDDFHPERWRHGQELPRYGTGPSGPEGVQATFDWVAALRAGRSMTPRGPLLFPYHGGSHRRTGCRPLARGIVRMLGRHQSSFSCTSEITMASAPQRLSRFDLRQPITLLRSLKPARGRHLRSHVQNPPGL